MSEPRRSERGRRDDGAESGSSSDLLLEQTHQRRRTWRVRMRVGSLLGLALMCLLFEQIGENRFRLAVILVLLTPVPALLPHLFSPRRWMLAQTVFDVGATVALSGLIPDAWTACLIVVVISPAASASMIGRRAYVLIETTGLLGLACVALALGVDEWQIPFGVAALMVPLVSSYADVAQTQRDRTERQLDELTHSYAVVLWELDLATYEVLFVGGEFEQVFGRSREALSADPVSMWDPDDLAALSEVVTEPERHSFTMESRIAHPDGGTRWIRLFGRKVRSGTRQVIRGTAIDITELMEAHHETIRVSRIDPVTGLANRTALTEHTDSRCREGASFGLFVLDFDGFRQLNETLGHDAGDAFLAAIGQEISRVARDDAFVARLGGDEFAVVSPVSRGMEQVMAIAHELAAGAQQVIDIGAIEYSGSASIGVAISPAHGTLQRDLLQAADQAVHRAKRSSSGIQVYDFDRDRIEVERLQISTEVEAALDNGDLRLWYQPKYDLGTRTVCGAEGLLRWQHPTRGPLTPAHFLHVVELTRHRRRLFTHILEQGVAFYSQARDAGLTLSVAVNVTLRDLLDPDFPTEIEAALGRAAMPADRLVLEITERELTDDHVGFTAAAAQVRELGVDLSIDDFGTGQSSLLRLQRLPVSELKIDRSFVMGLGTDPEADIIVRSIVELGRALGHRVVAEGVETSRALAQLRSLHCTHAQGYHFSPAVPPEEFIEMFAESAPPAAGVHTSAATDFAQE